MMSECPFSGTPISPVSGVPVYDINYYSDDVIKDPYPHYKKMRELGPIVYIPSLGNYAITSYEEAREALLNWEVFSSAQGLAGDKIGCDFFVGASNIVNDPPLHDQIRPVLAKPLMPNILNQTLRSTVQDMANELVDNLKKNCEIEGMEQVARYLPLKLVTDLVGLPEAGRENMLKWAAGAFDITGIQNDRGKAGVEIIQEMHNWVVGVKPEDFKAGSLTARIRDMVDAKEIPEEWFLMIMNDYITPALDTTISVTGTLLYLLGKNPDQWKLLKKNPLLIPKAVNEAVRMGSPIRSFSRTMTKDYEVAGVILPMGARVMIIYASANRDEAKFPNADKFDVTRGTHEHLGFGIGKHQCVGMHLAKIEMECLLEALLRKIDKIEVGAPSIGLNNTIHIYSELPITFSV